MSYMLGGSKPQLESNEFGMLFFRLYFHQTSSDSVFSKIFMNPSKIVIICNIQERHILIQE